MENGSGWLAFDGNNVAGTVRSGTANEWSFVHGPGLDDPLVGIYRGTGTSHEIFYWVTDGAGRHFAVADTGGVVGQRNDYETIFGSLGGKYAGGTSSSNSFAADRFGAPKATVAGVSLFRNRAYDQKTGRWLQEDPIGIAGGINLYQFNGNNPVSFTDPFGLHPCRHTPEKCTGGRGPNLGQAVAQIVGAVGDFVHHKSALDKDARAGIRGTDKFHHCSANCVAQTAMLLSVDLSVKQRQKY